MNWLLGITKEKFISILIYINRLLFVLPIALVIYVVFCLLIDLFFTGLLDNLYSVLSIIDTVLCVITIAHSVKNYNQYLKTAQNCVWALFIIFVLDRIDINQQIKDNYYYAIYWIIVIITFIISAYDNANENIKRYIKNKW